MNVLILGSGGREHALAWKISQSPILSSLFIAPGNAGTAQFGENLPVSADDFFSIKTAVLQHNISLVIIGPEAPLVNGINDFFRSDPLLIDIPVLGPSRQGAMLEGSKEFAKAFMNRHRIPTAAHQSFTLDSIHEGLRFLESLESPYVLKADGLAAGKGVLILNDLEKAKAELHSMLSGKFGDAGRTVVIEEFLNGIECSVFVLTDGEHYLILPEAKDYKRIGENDTGPNTGGMGAVSPVPFADPDFLQKVEERIVIPTIQGLRNEGIDYKGFIFLGLIKVNGEPMVIEYNARLGDPETEVVIPRIKNDLLEILIDCTRGELNKHILETDPRTACTVMLVAGGYPGSYEKGKRINGLDRVNESLVFHAGTSQIGSDTLTNGGRVLAVTSFGANLVEAVQISYRSISKIHFDDNYYRKDIGKDLIT